MKDKRERCSPRLLEEKFKSSSLGIDRLVLTTPINKTVGANTRNRKHKLIQDHTMVSININGFLVPSGDYQAVLI